MSVSPGAGKPRVNIPKGDYKAVCIGYTDLGTQPGFKGGEPVRKVRLDFDLPTLRINYSDSTTGEPKEGPRRISSKPLAFKLGVPGEKASALARYALALGVQIPKESKGKRTYWAKDFELRLEELVGRSCWLEIETGDSGYDDIVDADRLKGNDQPAVMECEPRIYETLSDTGDFVMPPSWVPQWLQAWILDSNEARAARGEELHAAAPKGGAGVDPDDVPF